MLDLLASMTQQDLQKIVNPILEICNVLVPVLIGVVGALGSIWCIYLGVKFSRAEEQQEHDKAKKALLYAVIGFVIIFVLLVMLELGVKIFSNWWQNYDYGA
jgi:heme O synthase-like polyprenyltransferase